MKILAIDTTTEACSAALHINGETCEKYEVAPRQHAELILQMIDRLLAESELPLSNIDGIAFACGPGAFTGVRLCTSVAQGLAYSVDLPLVSVSTLATLAQGAPASAENILSMLDARMGEIYWGAFLRENNSLVRSVSEERVCRPDEFLLESNEHFHVVGPGWAKYDTILADKLSEKLSDTYPDLLPRARHVAEIALNKFNNGESTTAKLASPTYTRLLYSSITV
ncbi:MAG: tRNA (adenosine(37)-N6)-threonylcarbamoyltransferase complex dimerization subunit type 1 TsaB [Gammaproteobacteria bacterium]|nr:tRNA (adenosine(37)-N6)-threonylcarbamoyltransferase complex dimerization subunit type 1 TsaB [Gammaproteobacteria bacterium]